MFVRPLAFQRSCDLSVQVIWLEIRACMQEMWYSVYGKLMCSIVQQLRSNESIFYGITYEYRRFKKYNFINRYYIFRIEKVCDGSKSFLSHIEVIFYVVIKVVF